MRINFYRSVLNMCRPVSLKCVGKKASILLLTGALMSNVLGGVSAQTVTLKERKATLYEVLEKIRKQANVDLIGDISLLAGSKSLSIDVRNKDIRSVLQEISSNQPVQLSFHNNTIIVKAKEKTDLPGNTSPSNQGTGARNEQQEYSLTGTVTDENRRPLKGVTVQRRQSSNWASVTSEDGTYTVRVTKDSELQFSMVGFETQVLKVSGRNQINVVLKQQEGEIEEVVATGYTNVRRENFTGAATTITRKELEKFNTNNIFTLLQAIDPSFKVDERVQAGSNPNTLPQINIRGISSVGEYAVNAPIVILDGFEVPLATLYDIDVNRIENIAILKDASSTSLYGSRGGNGVIVVETRLPKDGKFTVTYDMKPSFSLVDLSDYNLMNAAEKLEYERLAGVYQSASTDINFDHIQQEFYNNLYASRLENVLSGVDTYWLKQPVRNTFSVNNSLRMEGGGNDVRYSLEGSYNDYKGVMKESGRTRGGAGFNLIYRIPNVITFRNVANYLHTREYNSPYGAFSTYTQLNPYERIHDDDGNHIIRFGELGQWYSWGPIQFNPLYNAELGFKDQNVSHQVSNNLSLEWFINNEFILRARGALSRTLSETDRYRSPFHTIFYNQTDPTQRGTYAVGNSNKSNIEGRLDLQYSKNLNRHQIVGNLMTEARAANTTGNTNLLSGYIDDRFMTPQMALRYAEGTRPETISLPVRAIGFLGSFFYTYDNKYNYSMTLRSDGASIYGRQNRFGTFWSTGVSYNIHNEEWIPNDVFNRLKLFANIGTSSTVSDFNVGMVSTSYGFVSGMNYYNQYAAIYSGQGNPAVRWPEQKQLSLGMELGILEDLVKLDLSYYNRVTNRMISTITVAPSFGFYENKFFQNLGKARNRGFEIMANFRVLSKPENDLSWFLTAGAVQNRSKLLEISNELRSLNESLVTKDAAGNVIKPSNFYEEGQSLSVIYAVPSLGIDPASGRELFLDRTGGVTYTWNANNQRVVGNGEPDLYGTLGTAFNYRGLSIQVISNYSLGGDIYNQTLMDKIENNSPYLNADKRVLNERWKEPGDKALYKSISDQSQTQISSRFVQSESFLRVSSVNVNYTFMNTLLNKYKLERLRLNFSMNDMFRFSTVRMERGIEYPYAREYNFGIMVQF